MFDKPASSGGYSVNMNNDTVKALRMNESTVRILLDSASDGILMMDEAGHIVLVNAKVEELFGYDRRELLGQSIEILIPDHRFHDAHREQRARYLSKPHNRPRELGLDLVARRKNGAEFPAELSLSFITTEDGVRTIVFLKDITERKRAEDERLRMRLYLKNIIDSMPSIVVGVDPVGAITEWNSEAEKITGVSREKAQGRLFTEIMPHLEQQLEHVRLAIQRRQPIKTEQISNKVNGELHYSDVMVYPLIANGVLGAVIRVDDVTARVRIEEMMVQTEKMMSVGGLAAGMAHEINNPLGAILQGCQNIIRRISPDLAKNREVANALGVDLNRLHRYLEARGIIHFVKGIQEAGNRAARIVADMLAFSRRSDSQFAAVDLNELLDIVVRLAAIDYDLKKKYDFKHIEIIRDYDPTLEPVLCNRMEVEQVLLNLFKNAAQAMAANGTPPPHRITLRTRKEAKYACIEVIDNGPGMDEETRKRVFEPFFTTKAVGMGTGLGLSVSYFIVTEQHKGSITVDSSPGQGACFTIRLPLSAGD